VSRSQILKLSLLAVLIVAVLGLVIHAGTTAMDSPGVEAAVGQVSTVDAVRPGSTRPPPAPGWQSGSGKSMTATEPLVHGVDDKAGVVHPVGAPTDQLEHYRNFFIGYFDEELKHHPRDDRDLERQRVERDREREDRERERERERNDRDLERQRERDERERERDRDDRDDDYRDRDDHRDDD